MTDFKLGDNLYVQELETTITVKLSRSTSNLPHHFTEQETDSTEEEEEEKEQEKERRTKQEDKERQMLVTVICGIHDNIHLAADDPQATFMNKPFKQVITEEFGWSWDDLWPPQRIKTEPLSLSSSGPSYRPINTSSLFTARLFPSYFMNETSRGMNISSKLTNHYVGEVITLYQDPKKYQNELKELRNTKDRLWFSMEDILHNSAPQREFLWRKELGTVSFFSEYI